MKFLIVSVLRQSSTRISCCINTYIRIHIYIYYVSKQQYNGSRRSKIPHSKNAGDDARLNYSQKYPGVAPCSVLHSRLRSVDMERGGKEVGGGGILTSEAMKF